MYIQVNVYILYILFLNVKSVQVTSAMRRPESLLCGGVFYFIFLRQNANSLIEI